MLSFKHDGLSYPHTGTVLEKSSSHRQKHQKRPKTPRPGAVFETFIEYLSPRLVEVLVPSNIVAGCRCKIEISFNGADYEEASGLILHHIPYPVIHTITPRFAFRNDNTKIYIKGDNFTDTGGDIAVNIGLFIPSKGGMFAQQHQVATIDITFLLVNPVSLAE